MDAALSAASNLTIATEGSADRARRAGPAQRAAPRQPQEPGANVRAAGVEVDHLPTAQAPEELLDQIDGHRTIAAQRVRCPAHRFTVPTVQLGPRHVIGARCGGEQTFVGPALMPPARGGGPGIDLQLIGIPQRCPRSLKRHRLTPWLDGSRCLQSKSHTRRSPPDENRIPRNRSRKRSPRVWCRPLRPSWVNHAGHKTPCKTAQFVFAAPAAAVRAPRPLQDRRSARSRP